MGEYRLKIGVFEGTGSVWSEMFRGRPLPTILFVGKLR